MVALKNGEMPAGEDEVGRILCWKDSEFGATWFDVRVLSL